jgi:glycopeptide antibiotics resistance protein
VAFVGILGSNRGWIPVAVLGLASEAMQTLFGFGFEWEDAGDLAVNALGIIAGLMALNAWQKRRSRRQGERAITSPLCR